MMQYWFDTEFDEQGKNIELISIGIVAEDGREYYAINADYDNTHASTWLRQHVLNQLSTENQKPLHTIRKEVLTFFSPPPTEIWAYFGEYDWIVLRQLIGHMLDWPQGWPLSHMNIEQLRLSKAPNLQLPIQEEGLHHALHDARWTQAAWKHLRA